MRADSLRSIATTRLEREATERLMSASGFKRYLGEMKQLSEMQGLLDQTKDQAGALTDTTKMEELAREKATETAMTYVDNNPAHLKAAQKKVSLLMKKYSFVSKSNDLSSAIKKTSLKGRSFRERLVVAANFQLLSLTPVSIGLSPQLGNKLNTK